MLFKKKPQRSTQLQMGQHDDASPQPPPDVPLHEPTDPDPTTAEQRLRRYEGQE